MDLDVSRETIERLELYCAMVQRWTPKINLIAPSTVAEIWDRHILDSAQLINLTEDTQNWLDIGSGGGLPGVVVAIMLMEKSPGSRVTLIESDKRKCVFLQSVARSLGLEFVVRPERIEKIIGFEATSLSARALAPLHVLLGYSERNLSKSGTALFLKGRRWKEELGDAEREWSFELEVIQSTTSQESAVLKISNLTKRQ